MEKNERIRARRARKRRNRIFNVCLYVLSACLILFGVFIILRDCTYLFTKNSAKEPEVTFPPVIADVTGRPVQTALPSVSETPDPGPRPTPEPGKKPVSVSFVDYGVNVAVTPVGVDEDGYMVDAPSAEIAGWLESGACPNETGNCIIGGHIRYHGQLGLFAVLRDRLKVGDRITVTMEDGSYAFYTVISINEYPHDKVPSSVMAQTGMKRLTLITCKGDYDHIIHTSRTRIVAVCAPVE